MYSNSSFMHISMPSIDNFSNLIPGLCKPVSRDNQLSPVSPSSSSQSPCMSPFNIAQKQPLFSHGMMPSYYQLNNSNKDKKQEDLAKIIQTMSSQKNSTQYLLDIKSGSSNNSFSSQNFDDSINSSIR